MMSPSDSRRGSTGDSPVAGSAPAGSSIVELRLVPHSDDRPTIITGSRLANVSNTVTMGQTLGHFELLEPIGRGGMATVIKARDQDLGRIVALKILPPDSAADSETVNRFKQEGRAAARLDHDHIARVYFCGEDRGLHFIAFEFVAGDNLRTVLDQRKRLTPADAVRYMIHVAAGLQHASERGVVHRDIKPSNIIITPDGQAKIVDMGLARHLGSHSVNGGVTQSGVTLGTFDYISPEQALDPRRADVRSDIYSLGCTFYHALTGVPPVPEGTAARKLQAHQNEAPLDPRDINPAVPDELAAVLARMMAKDPGRRQLTADELLQDLAAVAIRCNLPLDGLPVAISETTASRKLFQAPPKVPVAWMLTGSVAVVALAILLGQPERQRGAAAAPWGDSPAALKPKLETTSPNTSASNEAVQNAIATVADLASACRGEGTVVLRLRSGSTYDLTSLSEGLVFSGTALTLEAETTPGTVPPIIRIAAAPLGDDRNGARGALTIRNCKDVKFTGIQFVIVPNGDEAPTMSVATAMAFDRCERVTFDGCRGTAESDVRDDQIAGITVLGSTRVIIRNSLFDFGEADTAIALRDAATLSIEESAFGPHRTAVDIRFPSGDSDTATANITFANSTIMIDRGGTAIRSSDPARTKVTASYCLFAGFDSIEQPDRLGSVMSPEDVEAKYNSFETPANHTNAYYRVSVPGLSSAASAQDSRRLTRSPWASSDPRRLLGGSEITAAFRVSLQDPKLRLPASSGAVLVGVKSLGHPEARIYPGTWPPERPQMVKATANERIVWTDADAEDAGRRVYPNFASAYAALEPGESLTLAVNGPVPVAPLPEKSLKATVRAMPGFKPVLVPEGPAFSVDATLFKLADGEITFDSLGFDLKERQSIVSAAGGTTCTFRNCFIALKEKGDHPVAAVVIPDPAREMKLAGSSDEGPRIRFENCFIRGDGRGVWVQAARGFELTFDNTAVALDGSTIVIDPADKPAGSEMPKCSIKLRRVTAVSTGPLLELKTGRTAGGTAAQVSLDAEQCLFAAADSRGSATALILLDDAEFNTDLAKYLTWGGRGSVYAYSDGAAAVEWRGSNNAMTGSWDWAAWLRFSRDDGRHQTRVRFANGSLKAKLLTATAADFQLSSFNTLDVGADVKKLPE